MQSQYFHTFTHLPRYFILGNNAHSLTRSFFHDRGIETKKTNMARRSFIKACNDMVSSSGQSNVGGMNISEVSNNGMGHFPKEVEPGSRNASVKFQNNENGRKSRYVVGPPKPGNKPPPAENLGNRWNSITKKDRNIFVGIDGDELPSDELIEGETKAVDTSYKVQRNLSLMDLARPYVPRTPTNSTRMIQEKGENKKEIFKANNKLQGVSDTAYVLPKFTPSFREMISTSRSKKDTLVSLTESTPPSLQKWALEWNSEPRLPLSIAELQEDIKVDREQRSTAPPDTYRYNNLDEEESLSSNNASPINDGEPLETMDGSEAEGNQNDTIKPSPKTVYEYLNRGESLDTSIEPAKYEKMLREMREAKYSTAETGNKPSVTISSKPPVNGDLDNYGVIRRGFRSSQWEKYSFRDTIRRTADDDLSPASSKQNNEASLRSNSGDQVLFDENMQNFHRWFRNRLIQMDNSSEKGKNNLGSVRERRSNSSNAHSDALTSDREATLESEYSEGDATWNQTKETTGLSKTKLSESKSPNMIEPPAEQYPTEKNSSFFQWLKQRGLMNVMMSRTSERTKPARLVETKPLNNEKVAKPEMKFPWSPSYVGKYISENSTNKKPRKELTRDLRAQGKKTFRVTNPKEMKYFKPTSQKFGGSNFRGSTPLRKIAPQNSSQRIKNIHKNVKPRVTNDNIETKKSIPELREKISPMKTSLGGHERSEAVKPYFGWAVGNELDHVKNMRYMENNHAAPQVMNRKKLFPSLYDQIYASSMNYWESKYGKSSTTPIPNSGIQLKGLDTSDAVNKKSRSLISVGPLSTIFYDRNFVNIADDPVIKTSEEDNDDIMLSLFAQQQVGEKISTGNHTLKAKPAGGPETVKDNSPIHLKFSRTLDPKPDEGLRTLKNPTELETEDQFSVQGLDAHRNEVDEEWTHMISPQGFNLDNDGDLIHLLKQSNSELQPSISSPSQS